MTLTETILLRLSREPSTGDYSSDYVASSVDGALRQILDPVPDFLRIIEGREVLDFGCGSGYQAVAMAQQGARTVVALDIDRDSLRRGSQLASDARQADRVSFVSELRREHQAHFDVVLSLNSMEHFSDPRRVLAVMTDAAKPGGLIVITFSPPWYAPYGSHMHFFTRIPWVHLLFSERTVMSVRRRFRSDGASRYEEVEGGLNRMTVRKFSQLVRQSGLKVVRIRLEAVKRLDFLTRIPLLRELFTNRVSCILEKTSS